MALEAGITLLSLALVRIFVPLFTVQTIMIGDKKSWQGVACVVVFTHFNQNELLVCGLSVAFENDLIAMIC